MTTTQLPRIANQPPVQLEPPEPALRLSRTNLRKAPPEVRFIPRVTGRQPVVL